jgi:hypothetical protein
MVVNLRINKPHISLHDLICASPSLAPGDALFPILTILIHDLAYIQFHHLTLRFTARAGLEQRAQL